MTGREALEQAGQVLRLHMAQFLPEIEACLDWLIARGRPARVLEIGTDYGGTAVLWNILATEQVISIDLPAGPYGTFNLTREYAEGRNAALRKTFPQFVGVIADSHEAATLLQVQDLLTGPLDLLFIDADHRYEGVKADYELYHKLVRPGGVVLFHDINDTPFIRSLNVGVYRLWGELQGDKHEFTVHGDWGGLGALVV